MKITMYELLGLIKDGKAPKKIKVTGRIYEFDKDYDMYYTKEKDRSYSVALGGLEDEINLIANAFNENVEIIEEDKKIEKIEIYEDEEGHYFLNNRNNKIYIRCDETDFMVDKFNKLIDKINNLKDK